MEKGKINKLEDFNPTVEKKEVGRGHYYDVVVPAKHRKFKADTRKSPDLESWLRTWELRPVTFLYYLKNEVDNSVVDEVKKMIKLFTGPMFDVNLVEMNFFNGKFKLKISGLQKDLALLKLNLDKIFAYYREDFKIEVGRQKCQ